MKTPDRRRAVLFVGLTALLSVPGYWLMVHPEVCRQDTAISAFMWTPAAAGLIMLALTDGRLRSIG